MLQGAYAREVVNLALAGVLWFVLIGCAVWSVLSRNMPHSTRKFWLAVIICVPFLGLLAYLPFSLANPNVIREWLQRTFPSAEHRRK